MDDDRGDAPRPTIRLARREELARLQEIEDRAGELYASVGLDGDLPGLSSTTLHRGQQEGLLWVAADTADTAIAFALGWLRPGTLHLREIDVQPEHAGRRIGRQLIEFVADECHRRGLTRVTLTTFRDVPWNAPLYERYGFEELDPSDWPDWMHAIRAEEGALGLDAWPRIAMVRVVG